MMGLTACKKQALIPQPGIPFGINKIEINDSLFNNSIIYNVSTNPQLSILFNAPLNKISVSVNVTMSTASGTNIPLNYSYGNNDSLLIIMPQTTLNNITSYNLF
ncbi:MAG: Ig-like domain-containing protein, partial [Chitinophagaceae bacterium]